MKVPEGIKILFFIFEIFGCRRKFYRCINAHSTRTVPFCDSGSFVIITQEDKYHKSCEIKELKCFCQGNVASENLYN
jgi:hypothetical protein